MVETIPPLATTKLFEDRVVVVLLVVVVVGFAPPTFDYLGEMMKLLWVYIKKYKLF